MDTPLLSVISIAYNNRVELAATIENVLAQSYPHIEYIVIDGGSKDGTDELLVGLDDKLDQWVSEPDKGIYDAMNKGLARATGEWIAFINAGDSFYATDTAAQLMAHVSPEVDFLYGHTQVKYADGYQRIQQAKPVEQFALGLPFVHQSMIARTAVLKQFPFDLSYKLCADFKQCYDAYQAGHRFQQIDLVFSNFEAGGVSDIYRTKTTKEVWRAIQPYRPGLALWLRYRLRFVKEWMKMKVKGLLGQGLVQKLIRMKYAG